MYYLDYIKNVTDNEKLVELMVQLVERKLEDNPSAIITKKWIDMKLLYYVNENYEKYRDTEYSLNIDPTMFKNNLLFPGIFDIEFDDNTDNGKIIAKIAGMALFRRYHDNDDATNIILDWISTKSTSNLANKYNVTASTVGRFINKFLIDLEAFISRYNINIDAQCIISTRYRARLEKIRQYYLDILHEYYDDIWLQIRHYCEQYKSDATDITIFDTVDPTNQQLSNINIYYDNTPVKESKIKLLLNNENVCIYELPKNSLNERASNQLDLRMNTYKNVKNLVVSINKYNIIDIEIYTKNKCLHYMWPISIPAIKNKKCNIYIFNTDPDTKMITILTEEK